MGFYKDNGYLNDDVTIFKNTLVGSDEYGDTYKWVGTLYKGLYHSETKLFQKNKGESITSESISSVGFFIIPVYLELKDGEEERIYLGKTFIDKNDNNTIKSTVGEFDSIPNFAYEIIHMVDCRRMKEIKSGSPATEWAVYV